MNALAPETLFEKLNTLGIETTTVEHPPVYTVEEAKEHRGPLTGMHIKNLFLRNKKKRMWLVVAAEDSQIDLKALGQTLDAGRLSFGSPQRLEQYLGVIPGAVTPFAAINDTDGEVAVVIDRKVFESNPVHCHPLVNTMTTAIHGEDLLRFLKEIDHEPTIIDLPN